MKRKKLDRREKWRRANGYYRCLRMARRRCKDVAHRCWPWYGGRGIRCLLTSDEAKLLWARDNGAALRRPSLDRKDSDGDYTFENCRYIELLLNIELSNQARAKTLADLEPEPPDLSPAPRGPFEDDEAFAHRSSSEASLPG